jgi:hypothetical protein
MPRDTAPQRLRHAGGKAAQCMPAGTAAVCREEAHPCGRKDPHGTTAARPGARTCGARLRISGADRAGLGAVVQRRGQDRLPARQVEVGVLSEPPCSYAGRTEARQALSSQRCSMHAVVHAGRPAVVCMPRLKAILERALDVLALLWARHARTHARYQTRARARARGDKAAPPRASAAAALRPPRAAHCMHWSSRRVRGARLSRGDT